MLQLRRGYGQISTCEVKVAQLCPTLCNPTVYPWNSPGQNTGVGSLSFLQGVFPTQGLNPGCPHCRRILYQLSHKGSPNECINIKKKKVHPFAHYSSDFWGPHFVAGRMLVLVSLLGIEPEPPAVETWSLNHWVTREDPMVVILKWGLGGVGGGYLFKTCFSIVMGH